MTRLQYFDNSKGQTSPIAKIDNFLRYQGTGKLLKFLFEF
ncbi:hypothetical protein SAMN05880501_101170 [Ureibacillus xyleni]|uniref:Uncharacterized protein n=1 Tax=Ureibacillus xyleni TaxID=614648 RepID=A0A285R9D1_9BACL|nr:hypothetical protein SAMN05880501_101170 [Ureibacillus xyleni]